jgi:hypothetical protein
VFVNSNTEAPRAAATLSFAPVQHCHFRPSSIILYALHGGRGMHVNITVRESGFGANENRTFSF